MAANRFGIDLAEVYRTGAAVKGARTANALNKLRLSEATRVAAERPGKEQKILDRENKLLGLRQKAVGGDAQAERQLLAMDPEGGAAFLDAFAKMTDKEAKKAQRKNEEFASMTATILQAQPEKRPILYGELLKMLPEGERKSMPPTYDENFLNMSLAKQRSIDKILDTKTIKFGGENILVKGGRETERSGTTPKAPGTPNVLRYGKEDLLYQDGKEIGRTPTAVKPTAGGKGGMKSADEALMYRQTVELLGGLFDEMGNITSLDPTLRNKVQAIATEATKIFRDDGTVTRSQAVRLAAKKFRMDIPDTPDPAPEGGFGSGVFQPSGEHRNVADPNNIRQYLLQN